MSVRLARPLAVLRRHPLWVGAGLAVLGFGMHVGIREYRVRVHRAEAAAALSHSDLEQAREQLAVCLRLRPGNAGLHLLAAQAARRAGLLDEASEHLEACKRLRGRTEADERLERTLLKAQGGGLAEVEGYLVARLEAKDPARNRILEALALANIQVYRLERGSALLRQLLEAEPDNVVALQMLGIVDELLNRADEALPRYRRALEFQPGNYRIRIQLAKALWGKGQIDEASRQFEQVLSTHRERAVLLGLARCRLQQGRAEEAGTLLDEALAQDANDAEALIQRGEVARENGGEAEAEVWLRKAYAVQPHNRQTAYQLAQCLLAQGRPRDAETFRRQVDRIDAEDRRLQELRKEALMVPGNPTPRYEVGAAALQRGDEEEGLRWLRGVLEIAPHHQPTHAALADYYQRRGQLERAAYHRSQAAGGAGPESGPALRVGERRPE
jgi:tetratricopeptide (TPR) repeat protein